ncbi:MAG: TIM barrel protein [bacterium]|nr:TIM barrel protein [bacterium]
MPAILLPYFALWRLPAFTTIRGAKDAGFDGVEIHLAGQSQRRALACRAHARRLGLKVHLHQGWSIEESSSVHVWNRLMHPVGLLPRPGYRLAEHIPFGVNDPVVIYAERWRDALAHPNWWLQTCRQANARLRFEEFVAIVERERLPVVFDLQHYLEFRLDLRGVGGLARPGILRNFLPDVLMGYLTEGWHQLGPLVREIHLDDCDPRLGHTRGRNVPLGTGVLPVRDFCRMVKESGWDGTVVPEVQPFLLHRHRRYADLRRQVADLFV